MNLNLKASELVGVVGRIDPDVQTAATYTTGWIDASKFHRYMAIVQAGTLGASATLNAKLEQATSAAGAGAKDITGKLITALTQAGTDDDKDAIINLHPSELDLDNAFTHFRLSMTVAVATSDAGAIVLGIGPRSGPATDNDIAGVDEVVA